MFLYTWVSVFLLWRLPGPAPYPLLLVLNFHCTCSGNYSWLLGFSNRSGWWSWWWCHQVCSELASHPALQSTGEVLVYLCGDAGFEKHRFVPMVQSSKLDLTNTPQFYDTRWTFWARGASGQGASSTISLNISWVRMSSSEVTQLMLWSRSTLCDIANDEFSLGFQSLKERSEGAARRRRRTTSTTYNSYVAVNVFIKEVFQK